MWESLSANAPRKGACCRNDETQVSWTTSVPQHIGGCLVVQHVVGAKEPRSCRLFTVGVDNRPSRLIRVAQAH
jgi:hypothetical protein